MASIFQGYEYDIFISYRHNDNLDGWVSDFVQNLERELKSTIKEPISIYFDTNPHDGLLETHNVDKSLEGKLKCLILIPVISQTYCDTRSFAWQNEFILFNKLSTEDSVGRDVKLLNGNFASRILPIRIHEIEDADRKLIENELGTGFRSINFIYREAGVNRPLKPFDTKNDNQNKTDYRNQINKVANAAKEIINSIKHQKISDKSLMSDQSIILQAYNLPFIQKLIARNVLRACLVYILFALILWKALILSSDMLHLSGSTIRICTLVLIVLFPFAIIMAWLYERSPGGFLMTNSDASLENPFNNAKKKPFTSYTFILLLIVTSLAIFLLFPMANRIVSTKISSNVEKSIAVLPFINDSPDQENTYFINGLMDELVNNLQKINNFTVLSRASTEQFRGDAATSISEIAKKLNVNYIVSGSGQKFGDKIRLRVQLIAAQKEKQLWGHSYGIEMKESSEIFDLQSQIARTIASELETNITPEEKQIMEKLPTTNLTAYDYYLRAKDEHTKYLVDYKNFRGLPEAISFYKLALKSDSTFSQAYTGLALALINYFWTNVADKMTYSKDKLRIVNDSAKILVNKALIYDKNSEEAYLVRGICAGDDDRAIRDYKKALEINPNYGAAYNNLADIFYGKSEPGEFITYKLKSIQLEKGPLLLKRLFDLGHWYEGKGFYENAIDLYNQKFQLTKDTIQYFQDMSGPYFASENWEESIRWAKKILEKNPDHVWANSQLADIYLFLGNDDLYCYYAGKVSELSQNADDVESYKGWVLWKHGDKLKADAIFNRMIDFGDNLIKSGAYMDGPFLRLAEIYSIKGEKKKAIMCLERIHSEYLRQRWFITVMEKDPFLQNIRSEKRFQEILHKSKSDWQTEHDKIRIWLQQNNLLKV